MDRSQLRTVEMLCYLILVAGTLGDHMSTVIALYSPNIYETNQFTVSLMSRGLWLPFDFLLITLGIAIPWLIIRIRKGAPFAGVLAYPLVLGLIRLGACVWNLSLI